METAGAVLPVVESTNTLEDELRRRYSSDQIAADQWLGTSVCCTVAARSSRSFRPCSTRMTSKFRLAGDRGPAREDGAPDCGDALAWATVAAKLRLHAAG